MESAARPGLAVFGDSIAAGLGAAGKPYGRIVADRLDLELLDYSASARCIPESLELLLLDERRPALAIVAHGITEAILRPSDRVLRLVPARWRRPGWMDPRPYFSRRAPRRLVQKLESGARWRVKKLLLAVSSPAQLLSVDSFVEGLRQLTVELERRGTRVIVLGAPQLDPRFFPGSLAQIRVYSAAAERGAREFVPLDGALTSWTHFCDDRFHPNAAGHQRIADLLLGVIRARP